MRASAPSANVILAKARAMYGNSLKSQNYLELLNCHSVSEVASYLKNRTSYAVMLTEINETTIHRGHLEMLLRRKLFNDYSSLSRYDATVGMHMSAYIIRRGEIDQIIQCLRLMNAGRSDEFFFSMPLFFTSQTRLDFMKMGKAKNQAELVAALGGTPYAKMISQFPPENGHIRITEIENALHTYLTNTLLTIIDDTSGDLHEQLENLCGTQIDVQNVSRIVRMKRYFGMAPDLIRANLLPSGRCIPEKTMDKMIDAPTADEVLRIFYTTRVGKSLPEAQRRFIHDLHHRVPYFNARRHIHYSIHPMVVLVSYIILTDVELDDIINIIEGIRYGMPPEEIKPMLVLLDQ